MRGKLSWDETVRYIFYGVAAFMFNRATNVLDKLQGDVSTLTVTMATSSAKNDQHFDFIDFRLVGHEGRIVDLEKEAKEKNRHN